MCAQTSRSIRTRARALAATDRPSLSESKLGALPSFFFQTATAVVADEGLPIDRVSDAGEPFVQFLSNGMICIWPAPSNSALSKTWLYGRTTFQLAPCRDRGLCCLATYDAALLRPLFVPPSDVLRPMSLATLRTNCDVLSCLPRCWCNGEILLQKRYHCAPWQSSCWPQPKPVAELLETLRY